MSLRWLLLVDLNYNFECDWLINLSDDKLSDKKLSDNNLASELVEKKYYEISFELITIEEILIFTIKGGNELVIIVRRYDNVSTKYITNVMPVYFSTSQLNLTV